MSRTENKLNNLKSEYNSQSNLHNYNVINAIHPFEQSEAKLHVPSTELKPRKRGTSETNNRRMKDKRKELQHNGMNGIILDDHLSNGGTSQMAAGGVSNPFSGPKLHLFRKGQSKSSQQKIRRLRNNRLPMQMNSQAQISSHAASTAHGADHLDKVLTD